MTFEFVNANGQPINIELAKAKAKLKPQARRQQAISSLKRVDSKDVAKVSEGFVVFGFSPDHIAAAKRAHEEAVNHAISWNASHEKADEKLKVPQPWDEEAYMRSAKPKRARSKPYEIEAAADECAELCRRAGWLQVRVDELLKG